MDKYDKMAEFLVANNIDNCDFCKAIEITGNNNCCDNEKLCVRGIAKYLRDKKVLQIDN